MNIDTSWINLSIFSTLRKFYGLYGHVKVSNFKYDLNHMINNFIVHNFVVLVLWLAGTWNFYHVLLSSLKLKTVSLSHEIVRSMYSKRLKSKSTDSNSIDKPSNTTTPKTYSWHFMYKRNIPTYTRFHTACGFILSNFKGTIVSKNTVIFEKLLTIVA